MRFAVLFLLLIGCDSDAEKAEIQQEREARGRFETVERFKVFDNAYPHDGGRIIRDRKTGACFLYIWGGAGNGGPAITSIPCPS